MQEENDVYEDAPEKEEGFKKALDHVSFYIKAYRDTDLNDGNGLAECLQQISATLFYLEKERAVFHDQFQKRIHQLILAGDSVSRAENKANAEIPQMYLLRRVMDSAYKACDAIRTNISWLKSGLINN